MLDYDDPRLLPLIEVLQQLPGDFHWLPNPGNWGDAIIREGAEGLFRELGLTWRRIDRLVGGKVLVYGGGGAWCRYFRHGFAICGKALSRYENVIVLPSTYERRYHIDSSRLIAFARDDVSRREFHSLRPTVPDLAFLLPRQSVGRQYRRLVAWRTNQDRHPNRPETPSDNIDISAAGSENSPALPFLSFVGMFDEVETDRLHVAIAGAIQGCRTVIRPNGYFKTRAAVESFPDLFPNTELVDW